MTTTDRETDAPGRGGMTRDELIERLAGIAYDGHQYANVGHALEKYGWPLIVEFVAEWMSNWYGQDPRTGKPYAMRMPGDWREEMS